MLRRPPGRPHKKKRKEVNEANGKRFKISKKGNKLNCKKYDKPGYNIRTCRAEVKGNSRINPATVAKSYRSKLLVSCNLTMLCSILSKLYANFCLPFLLSR